MTGYSEVSVWTSLTAALPQSSVPVMALKAPRENRLVGSCRQASSRQLRRDELKNRLVQLGLESRHVRVSAAGLKGGYGVRFQSLLRERHAVKPSEGRSPSDQESKSLVSILLLPSFCGRSETVPLAVSSAVPNPANGLVTVLRQFRIPNAAGRRDKHDLPPRSVRNDFQFRICDNRHRLRCRSGVSV
jgi:hypothetical protein